VNTPNRQQTFFFYDLETSGIDPKRQRIMQFAGQRTDMDFNLMGEPVNALVALSEDVLPDPAAVLITGITPQKTQAEGYSEAEFLRLLHEQVLTPNTIISGFNTVRFDDEFMRYTLYRNFYDPYEWQWKDSRSRWDLLDVVRLTRALRPEGIEWPVDANGQPTNRLELLTTKNGLDHEHAHDALNDVLASIAVAKLIKQKQPKLFEYLLSMRSKQAVMQLVNLDQPQPFVYTSGRYPKETLHTTVAYPLAPGSKPGSAIVYDLRSDPAIYADKPVKELKDWLFATYEQRQQDGFTPVPAKELAYNKCPAVAPLGVLDADAQKRIGLDMKTVEEHLAKLRKTGLADKLREVFVREGYPKVLDVDGRLYDGFVGDGDKTKMAAVRSADTARLAELHPQFADERLNGLLLRYKARNFPRSLSTDERAAWEAHRAERVAADGPRFVAELKRLAATTTDDSKQYILQELQLWLESIMPEA
jgi:exodeoxyribonuclease I